MNDRSSYRHIGIFDSGLGGLTVVRALSAQAPSLDITYFGDTARLPYGPKSPAVVTQYAFENAALLLAEGVELIVVACNTATAHALEALQSWAPVPVLGVVEPGAQAACAVTKGHVAVLGTHGTVQSGVYPQAIQRLRPGTEVKTLACPLFVPLVEEGYAEHDVTRLIAREYLEQLGQFDTLLLGCTHYPRLHRLLEELLGPGVAIVDSARSVADCIRGEGSGRRRYLVSDDAERFAAAAATFLGEPISDDRVIQVEVPDTRVYSVGDAGTASPTEIRPSLV